MPRRELLSWLYDIILLWRRDSGGEHSMLSRNILPRGVDNISGVRNMSSRILLSRGFSERHVCRRYLLSRRLNNSGRERNLCCGLLLSSGFSERHVHRRVLLSRGLDNIGGKWRLQSRLLS